jgi:hypothetical protein
MENLIFFNGQLANKQQQTESKKKKTNNKAKKTKEKGGEWGIRGLAVTQRYNRGQGLYGNASTLTSEGGPSSKVICMLISIVISFTEGPDKNSM